LTTIATLLLPRSFPASLIAMLPWGGIDSVLARADEVIE
jgi:hypothetical protein